MVIKLRLILRRIPWSLPVKAFFLALAWFEFPYWIFTILAFALYFFPLFQTRLMFVPFLLLIALAFAAPVSVWFTMVLASAFFLLFGIKELHFIGREKAYEALVLLLLFSSVILLFLRFENWEYPYTAFWMLTLSIFFVALMRDLTLYVRFGNYSRHEIHMTSRERIRQTAVIGLAAFLLWQISIAILFLPISFFHQAALLFFAAAVLLEFLLEYFGGTLGRRDILMNFSFFFLLVVFVLTASEWGL